MRTLRSRRPNLSQHLSPDAPWTLIGPGSVVHGELLMTGNVVIHGRVEGTLFTDGEVWVAEGGAVEGGVHASRVVVDGVCHGRVEATDEVVLRRGAIVRGDIEANVLTTDTGARFVGGWVRPEKNTGPRLHPYQDGTPGQA